MAYGAAVSSGPGGALAVEVLPRSPFRIPTRRWPDSVARTRAGVYERYLHIDDAPILLRAWQGPGRSVSIAAVPVPVTWLDPRHAERFGESAATREQLERALDRGRMAIGVDDDLSEFHARFRGDALLGPLIRRMPWLRPRRTAHPWEALAWAITEQLIESQRAAQIQRRIVRRWGAVIQIPGVRAPLRDVPGPAVVAGLAPAELAALDLAPKRALALIKVAREVASGRCDLTRGAAGDDSRLAAISEIGAWTLQVLGLNGRGDLDSLPAGDLAYLKLVGRLAGLGRRATIVEVEEFYAPYEPYRGISGLLTLNGMSRAVASGPPLRYHPPAPEYEAA